MSPFDAKEIIVKGSGTDFDPTVVNAFVEAFRKGELEVPDRRCVGTNVDESTRTARARDRRGGRRSPSGSRNASLTARDRGGDVPIAARHERRSAERPRWLRAGAPDRRHRLRRQARRSRPREARCSRSTRRSGPGVTLTLEMTRSGLDAAVPLEVLRCYIANLRGKTATYRGACRIRAPDSSCPARRDRAPHRRRRTSSAPTLRWRSSLERCASLARSVGRVRRLARAHGSAPRPRRAADANIGARQRSAQPPHLGSARRRFFPRSATGRREMSPWPRSRSGCAACRTRGDRTLQPIVDRLASLIDHCAAAMRPPATRR